MRINVDVGEGFPWDAELAEHADMLNICAGEHAGSPEISRRTMALAEEHGIVWGIHPGYPDREGFGRRPLRLLATEDVSQSLAGQVEGMLSLGEPTYIKPHGAFYHDSLQPGMAAELLLELLHQSHLPLVGFPGSHHQEIARQAGVEFWSEGFAERGYDGSGRLLDRSLPGAILTERDDVLKQARKLKVDTICVHGDSPHCVRVMGWLREIWPR